jgi:hypothetical protein
MFCSYVELSLVCETQGKRSQAAQIAGIALDTIIKAQGHDHPIVSEYMELVKKFGGVVPQLDAEADV